MFYLSLLNGLTALLSFSTIQRTKGCSTCVVLSTNPCRMERRLGRGSYMANPLEQLPQLFCQLLDQFWSSMKLSRGILKEHDAPRAVAPGGDKCVNRIKCGLDIRLCGWHHASDRPEKGNIRTQ